MKLKLEHWIEKQIAFSVLVCIFIGSLFGCGKRVVNNTPLPSGINSQLYREWRSPREGNANPERLTNPLWKWLIDSKVSAFQANARLGDVAHSQGPGWCFSRFGQSTTDLPDGNKSHRPCLKKSLEARNRNFRKDLDANQTSMRLSNFINHPSNSNCWRQWTTSMEFGD